MCASSLSTTERGKPTLSDRLNPNHHLAATPSSPTQHPASALTATPSKQGTIDDESASDTLATTTTTTVTLGHILINAIILQEFLLEIAAVVQVRACLWGEVEL